MVRDHTGSSGTLEALRPEEVRARTSPIQAPRRHVMSKETEIMRTGISQETASEGGATYVLLQSVLIVWTTWVRVAKLALIRGVVSPSGVATASATFRAQ